MNSRGLYSAAVALVAATIVIAIAFSMNTAVEMAPFKSHAEEIVDLKWEMQNASYIVSKSAADAIADGSCPGGSLSTAKVANYVTTALGETSLGCETTELVANISGSDIVIDATITCSKAVEAGHLEYGKTFTIVKTVAVSSDLTGCYIDVEDKELGECEVDKIDSSQALNLCDK